MPFFLALLLTLTLLVTAAVLAFFIWQAVREQARFRRTLDLSVYQVLVPKDITADQKEEGVGQEVRERIAVAEQWLSTLAQLPASWHERLLYGAPVVALEIVARSDGVIAFYTGVERRFADHLEKQIYSFYPDAEVTPATDYTIFNEGDTIKAGYLSMANKSHLPIATYQELEADPMQAMTGALARLQEGDAAVMQLLCQPASKRARRKGRQAARRTVQGKQDDIGRGSGVFKAARDAVTQTKEDADEAKADASKLTPRAQQRVELVENKVSQQQFKVNIRVAVATRQPEEATRVYNAVTGAFSQYELPDLNGLAAHEVTQTQRFLRDLIFRVPRAAASAILSTTELASLFHFPLPTTGTPNIQWRGAKVAPVSAEATAAADPDGIVLGHNVYRGVDTPIHMNPDDRRRHLYLIGQTGTGKTTLFLNMIVQDIAAGHGVGVVDPHGDLIEDILLHIPPERAEDVILFDPRDGERPLGFNILESRDAAQKDLVVNEVVQILQKLAARLNPESVGPMFEHYLRNALMALAEDDQATLLDVPRMFVDEPFRKAILKRDQDPTVRQFWEKEYEQSQRGQMSADMLSYVVSKLGRFIGNAVVRNMIGQATSSFDVRQVMDEKKILLCNLSKGHLGDINADLLGFVLVSKIQIAALGRADVSEDQRPDFYLYLDEFQNFTTDSIGTILSEARKYRLNLNITHQFIQQLDDPIKEAVFGNVGTVVSYRIGVDDAEFMAQQFDPVFTEYDLLNLERFTACIRPLVNGTPARPFSLRIPPPPAGGDADNRDAIREHSRQTYGRNRADIEQDILQRFQIGDEPAKPAAASGGGGDYLSESLFDIN